MPLPLLVGSVRNAPINSPGLPKYVGLASATAGSLFPCLPACAPLEPFPHWSCCVQPPLFCARKIALSLLPARALFVKTHKGKWAPLCISSFTSHSDLSSCFCLKRKYGQYPVPFRLVTLWSYFSVVLGDKRSSSLSFKLFLSLGSLRARDL